MSQNLRRKQNFPARRRDGEKSENLPLYWAAKAGKATHFLTGDLKDFGPYMDKPRLTDGVLIQTVRAFIDAL